MHNRLTPLLSVLLISLLVAACGGGSGGSSESTNSAPVASNPVAIDANGAHALPGDVLHASYSYSDADRDAEGASQIIWLRNNQPIEAASDATYTLTDEDEDQSLSFQVIPVAVDGVREGEPVTSPALPVGYRPGTRVPAKSFYSAQTDWTYLIHVYLPAGYTDSNSDYSVMYQLDGQTRFEPSADMLDEKAKKIVLISIGTKFDQRFNDYLFPGAVNFYDFVTLELIPAIEAQYRIDSKKRTLMGHSLGGLFTGSVMLTEQPADAYFDSYVASDGSFQYQIEIMDALEEKLSQRTDVLPTTLIMVVGTSGNLWSGRRFHNRLLASDYGAFDMHYMEFYATHEQTFALTFATSVDMLYPDPSID